ncbi:winged helix-turn-helix transcriptional regulator [Streptomyces sp. NPDC054796]
MHNPHSGPAHADQTRHAVGVLAPRWTTWTLETLHARGPLRARELNAAMPWLNTPTMAQVLQRMHSSALLTKPAYGRYAPSPLGHSARAPHQALASWHARHFEVDATTMPRPDRAEDALAKLRGKGALEMLTALEQHGPLRPGALREAAGLATGTFHYRTHQLLDDGLLTRLGPDQHWDYTLTPAARDLGPVHTALHDFGHRSQTAETASRSIQHTAQERRARAARQHSPTTGAPAVLGLFSHAPAPPPRVPAHLTALSHPSRSR